MSEKQVLITMLKKNFDDILDYPFPQGYSMRSYAKGDKQLWVNLYNRLDEYSTVTAKEFEDSFGDDHENISKRMFFLCCDGKEIGTVTDWAEDDIDGIRTARVHWIGVESGHRGKNLGGAMLSFILKIMRENGNEQAVLGTMSERIAALNLYFKFGFEAAVISDKYSPMDDQAKTWRLLKNKMPMKYQKLIKV